MDNDNQVSKYDRIRGQLSDVALFTKQSTVRQMEKITGRAETYLIETGRHEDGDYIFVEFVDDKQAVTRLVLPPRAANIIASQRDSLTARRRSIASKALAKARKDAGIVPGFMKNPGHKKKKQNSNGG